MCQNSQLLMNCSLFLKSTKKLVQVEMEITSYQQPVLWQHKYAQKFQIAQNLNSAPRTQQSSPSEVVGYCV